MLQHWTEVEVGFDGHLLKVEALAMQGVDFVFILSRPDMKRLKMNISWRNEVTIHGSVNPNLCGIPNPHRRVRSADVILANFPELICVETNPRAADVLEVHFKLRDVTVVRKKP